MSNIQSDRERVEKFLAKYEHTQYCADWNTVLIQMVRRIVDIADDRGFILFQLAACLPKDAARAVGELCCLRKEVVSTGASFVAQANLCDCPTCDKCTAAWDSVIAEVHTSQQMYADAERRLGAMTCVANEMLDIAVKEKK